MLIVCILLLAIGALVWAVAGIVLDIELPDITFQRDVQDSADAGMEIFDDIGNQTAAPGVHVEDGVSGHTIRTIEVEGFFSQGLVRGSDIYLYYIERVFPYFYIYIRRIDVDQIHSELVAVLEWLHGGWPRVVGFDVADEGGFRLLIWDTVWDDDVENRLFYTEFDAAGNLTFINEIPDTGEAIGDILEVAQVMFADTGDILIRARDGTIYILYPDGSPRTEIVIGCEFGHMARMRDGRVLLKVLGENDVLWEIDLETGMLGETRDDWLPENMWFFRMYSAQAGSRFDLYAARSVSRGAYFYGFDLSDMSWTRVIVREDMWFLFTEFLEDGRLVMLEMGPADRNMTYIHIIIPEQ